MGTNVNVTGVNVNAMGANVIAIWETNFETKSESRSIKSI